MMKSMTENNLVENNEKANRVIHSKTRDAVIEKWLSSKIKKYIERLNGNGGNLYDLVLLGIEKPLINIVLREVKGNQVCAANILGINRNTLRKKIDQYNIKLKKP